MTLPQAVKLFPVSWKQEIIHQIPNDYYTLSYLEKFEVYNSHLYNSSYYLSNKDGRLFFGEKITTIQRLGKRFYPNVTWKNVIVIEKNKITVKQLDVNALKAFLSIIGIDIINNFDEYSKNYLLKKTVIADILRKKVYNEKTLYKCVLSKIYRIKELNWKLYRSYLHNGCHLSLYDLKEFTKDVNKSVGVLVSLQNYNQKYTLLSDILNCAIKLNEVVDFTWSEKRLKEEHDRQIRLLNYKQISKKENTPVYDLDIDTPTVKLLNTEKDVFIEGMSMNHCLYSCYWAQIKNKQYLAFHMTSPEDCTFSVKIRNHQLVMDQIYLSHDRPVQNTTRLTALEYIKSFESELTDVLTEHKRMTYTNPGIDAVELPF